MTQKRDWRVCCDGWNFCGIDWAGRQDLYVIDFDSSPPARRWVGPLSRAKTLDRRGRFAIVPNCAEIRRIDTGERVVDVQAGYSSFATGDFVTTGDYFNSLPLNTGREAYRIRYRPESLFAMALRAAYLHRCDDSNLPEELRESLRKQRARCERI